MQSANKNVAFHIPTKTQLSKNQTTFIPKKKTHLREVLNIQALSSNICLLREIEDIFSLTKTKYYLQWGEKGGKS